MATPAAVLPPPDPSRIDQRVRLHDVGWRDYEALLAMRGDEGGVRVTYLEGEVELTTPSIQHEALKKRLARLLEAYAEARGLDLEGYGSWTVKSEARRLGVEADECYVLGDRATPPEVPDLAIEVVWISGGIDKLEVYRGLGVPEVWFWQNGALRLFVLEGERYRATPRSHLIPDLDPTLLERFMTTGSQTEAVRAYRQELQEEKGQTQGAS